MTEEPWNKHTPSDPYNDLEWDEYGIATVVLKNPGCPEWVLDDDLVRFSHVDIFSPSSECKYKFDLFFSFQIKRRPILTPAVPQVLEMLAVATDDEADAIRSAARRAKIEVPE